MISSANPRLFELLLLRLTSYLRNGPTVRATRPSYILLDHLTESWRQAVDNNLVVATAFIDFQKAFDCVSHRTLLHKLKTKFGIEGNLLSWITDYLHCTTEHRLRL